MVEHRWIANTGTGDFLVGGPEPYEPTPVAGGTVVPGTPPTYQLPAGLVRLVLTRAPNLRTEKYSGVLSAPFGAKSSAEIAAADAALADADAAAAYDMNKILKAKAVSDLAFRLGKAPGALTAAEIASERSRIIAIYKSLP